MNPYRENAEPPEVARERLVRLLERRRIARLRRFDRVMSCDCHGCLALMWLRRACAWAIDAFAVAYPLALCIFILAAIFYAGLSHGSP